MKWYAWFAALMSSILLLGSVCQAKTVGITPCWNIVGISIFVLIIALLVIRRIETIGAIEAPAGESK
jgi:Na+/proline symporter